MIYSYRVIINGAGIHADIPIKEDREIDAILNFNHARRVVSIPPDCEVHKALVKVIKAFSTVPESATLTVMDAIKGPIIKDYYIEEFMRSRFDMAMVLMESFNPDVIDMVHKTGRLQYGNTGRYFLYVPYRDFTSRFKSLVSIKNYIIFGYGFNYINFDGKSEYETNSCSVQRATLPQLMACDLSKSIADALSIDFDSIDLRYYREMPFERPYKNEPNDIIKFERNKAPVLYRSVPGIDVEWSTKLLILSKYFTCVFNDPVNRVWVCPKDDFIRIGNTDDMRKEMTMFMYNGDAATRYYYQSNFFKIDANYRWHLDHDEHHVPHADIEVDYILRFVVDKTA